MTKGLDHAVRLVALAALASCAEDIVPPGPAPHVRITGGNAQIGAALDTLALPLEITVVDDEGKPATGRTVTWTAADRTGRVIPGVATTDGRGRARAIWVLGIDSGEHTASAVVTGEEGAAEFTATATPAVGFKAIALMQGSTASAREPHMCALASDSLAWCWGGNAFGELGNGTSAASTVPVAVAGGRTFVSVHGDEFNSCGLRASGELWCWGRNTTSSAGPFAGVFGNGMPAESSSRPVLAAQGLLFQDFDLEVGLACGITMDGRGFCWGNGRGALGIGTGLGVGGTPAEILGDRRWREIAVTAEGRCALAEDYRAYCWLRSGFDRWTWIGVPSDAGPIDTPLLVEITGPSTALTMGEFGPCALSLVGAGTAVCWGIGAADPPPGPAYHRLGSSVRKIVSDGFARAALDAQGQLWVWNGGCCSLAAVRAPPVLLFPGVEWSDVSVATGLHVVSARDSIAFSLGPIPESVSEASFELVPVPLP